MKLATSGGDAWRSRSVASPYEVPCRPTLRRMGVLNEIALVWLLASAVGLVVLDAYRNRRRGATGFQVLKEVGHQPSDWELIVSAVVLLLVAGGVLASTWFALGGLPVYGFVHLHLRGEQEGRAALPKPNLPEAIREPASNVRVR